MKLGKKIIIVLLFIIGIAGLLVGSIAYYRIVVSGSIEGSTGNAVFALRDTEAGESWNNKVISLGQINPGDSGSFDVVMDASGSTVDMYATLSIDRTNLPTNLKFYTTSDHKSELHKYYSFLEKSGTNKETLTIYWYWNPYIDDVEDSKFINMSFSASINVSAVQISEYAMMKNRHTGTEFWNSTYMPYIRTITFENELSNLPSSCAGDDDLCWDVSYSTSQKKKVYAYLIDSGLKDSADTTKSLYNLYIVSDAPIFAPYNCSEMFKMNGKTNLISIDFNNNFNTSKVTSMYGMFEFLNCDGKIEELDLSDFNTSNVTDMHSMFDRCTKIKKIDLSNFNTSNVTKMNSMFNNCNNVLMLNLSTFDTSKVTDMSYMFRYCYVLTSLNSSSFNTSNVTYMLGMFWNCNKIASLDLSNFNTSNVTYMSWMFYCCTALTSLDVGNFDTSKVKGMDSMFYGCKKLERVDLSNFNTSNVTDMRDMFSYCSSLKSLDLSSFNTSKVTVMTWMFHNCSSLTSLDLSNFNTSNVTEMTAMFNACSSLIELDLSSFDTSNVTTYGNSLKGGFFANCTNLTTTINIMNANVTSYYNMFANAATASGAKITVNYIADASTLVDSMIATKSSNSNVVKGSQI